jgi:DnaK suppressor protein
VPRKAGAPLDKFQEGQKTALLEERATYIRQASALREEADELARDREPGDVQFDEESGQGDTMNVERERDLALSAQAMSAVDEIDRALEKLIDGTYGICERCGQQIPKERLRAIPWAALCVQCKSGGLSRR